MLLHNLPCTLETMPPILPPLLFAVSATLLPALLAVSLAEDDTFDSPSPALDVTFLTASVAFAVVDSARRGAREERTREVSCRDGRWIIWRANMVRCGEDRHRGWSVLVR